MKLIEYLKDKNVITLDVWVLIALLILYPAGAAKDFTLSSKAAIPSITFSVVLLILTIFLLLACSRLRGYRYLDWYLQCKKPASVLSTPIIFVGVLANISLVFWVGFSLYDIIAVLFIAGLSFHLNNTKELKHEAT